jgi:hypothetical protein
MNGDRYIMLSRQETGFPSHPTAFAHQAKALAALAALGDAASSTERALITAQQVRFVRGMDAAESDGNVVLKVNPQMDALNRAFADACREASLAAPDDPNLAWCLAEALMNCRPWSLWDINTGEKAPETAEIVESLARGLALAPEHPGLCHCAVHCYEMSPYPERCLPQCDVIRTFSPDNGHLLHMPSHIDVLVGQYKEAVTANAKAIDADLKCIANNVGMLQMIGFTCHNHHMLVCKSAWAHRSTSLFTTFAPASTGPVHASSSSSASASASNAAAATLSRACSPTCRRGNARRHGGRGTPCGHSPAGAHPRGAAQAAAVGRGGGGPRCA